MADRTARVVTVPRLTPCPECGVELARGAGPHRLAWHGCRPRGGAESVEQELLAAISAAAKEAKPDELIRLLAAIREHRRLTGSGVATGDAEVGDWLARRPIKAREP